MKPKYVYVVFKDMNWGHYVMHDQMIAVFDTKKKAQDFVKVKGFPEDYRVGRYMLR